MTGPSRRLLTEFGPSSRMRFFEAHSGLSALVLERSRARRAAALPGIDGLWLSSLTQTAVRARPDDETLGLEHRMSDLDDIRRISGLPVLFDGDSGGSVSELTALIETLHRHGADGLVIEDKVGPKVNSLRDWGPQQRQADPREFAAKVRAGVAVARPRGLIVVARIESLITGLGPNDALDRASRFVDAGADAVMIHSRRNDDGEIRNFCAEFRRDNDRTAVIVVPSTFDDVPADALFAAGVNMVIYANQLLRAAHRAMTHVVESILDNDRAAPARSKMTSIPEILRFIPEDSDRRAP